MALAVVYFISVLMVSKYRDILEPQRETARIGGQSGLGLRPEINSLAATTGASILLVLDSFHPSTNFSESKRPWTFVPLPYDAEISESNGRDTLPALQWLAHDLFITSTNCTA